MIIVGTEEFTNAINTVMRRAPDRIIVKLESVGRKVAKEVKDNVSVESGKAKASISTKRVNKVMGVYTKEIVSNNKKAPHWHLYEKGHRQLNRRGEEIGFIPGANTVERVMAAMEDDINADLQIWMNRLFRGM